jgi:hypothetical protein
VRFSIEISGVLDAPFFNIIDKKVSHVYEEKNKNPELPCLVHFLLGFFWGWTLDEWLIFHNVSIHPPLLILKKRPS